MPQLGVVTIIGPGLIGGSIGLAVRQRGLAQNVVGVTRSDASANRALACGVVQSATTDLAQGVATADLVVACTPVGGLAQTVLAAAQNCKPGAIITDAGSTKASLAASVEASLPNNVSFLGSHPLAGDHRSGPESARADLLEGRMVVVTPTGQTDQPTLRRIRSFWESLGASVTEMPPAQHDAALALTSHLPHAAAAVLAGETPEDLLRFAGGGWRDTTRVAAGSVELWRDILLDNRAEVAQAIESLEGGLKQLRLAIHGGDSAAIERILAEGKRRRDALGS